MIRADSAEQLDVKEEVQEKQRLEHVKHLVRHDDTGIQLMNSNHHAGMESGEDGTGVWNPMAAIGKGGDEVWTNALRAMGIEQANEVSPFCVLVLHIKRIMT